MRKKSNNNFVQEQPRQGWAYFEDSNQWRRTPEPWGAPGDHFPREYGDWVAVSKPQGWQPPAGTLAGESLLDGGGARLNATGSGGSGSGTKIGAGGKPQPYGKHGWYGVVGGGSISGGYEVRGPVTPPAQTGKVIPPPPPAPRQPHLTYGQGSGELLDANGKLLDCGHSGYGEYRDKPEHEAEKNLGVIPRGNYKVTEVIEDTKLTRREGMGQHILRLEPADKETTDRLEAMNRDGFWIHDGRRPTASRGCILLDEAARRRIAPGTLLRVTL